MSSPRQSKANRTKGAPRLSLRLYVAGRLPGSVEAEARLRALCAEPGVAGCEIEVVDMLQEPERALTDGIVVTPTLVRLSPQPTLRILGALSNEAQVRLALGLDSAPPRRS